jgi:zinc protease
MTAPMVDPSLSRASARTVTRVLLGAAASLFVFSAPAHAQQPPHGVRDTTLANGLEVRVLEDHSAPLATVLVAVRTGAFTQRPNEAGLAHVYEHMLFRTYKMDPGKFDEEAANLKAAYNGETSEETVQYYMMLPSENTDKAIDQLAHLVTRARFRDKDLDEELPVVLDELARDAADPDGQLAREEDRALWGDSWYRKDVGGDSTSLKHVTLSRLQEYFDRYYVPNNAALFVTGDVDAEQVFRAAADHFGGWDRKADPFAGDTLPPMTPLSASQVVVVTSAATEATIRVEFQGPGLDRDPAAAEAMARLVDILDEPGSRFRRDMVGNGPFRELECDFAKSRSAGTVVFVGTAALDRATEAARTLSDTLNDLTAYLTGGDTASGGVKSLEDLDRALALEEGATLAPYMATLWGRGEVLDLSTSHARKVSAADVLGAARTYLEGRPRVIGVIVPGPLAEQVRTGIKSAEGK